MLLQRNKKRRADRVWSAALPAAIGMFLAVQAAAQSTPFSWQLPFEQGLITYEISGMESGRELLYIKDFGATTARHRETSTTILGVTRHLSSLEITTPQWVYSFDLQQRTGSKSVNPRKLMIEEYGKLDDADRQKVNDNARSMASVLMDGHTVNLEQKVKEILGYACDRAAALGSTVYTIHGTGIALMSETDLMGVSLKSVATSIVTGETESKYFEFPKDITLHHDIEADQVARLMAQRTIEALKDPERLAPSTRGFMGMPSSGRPEIPEEDQVEMEEAMETIKGLLGN